MVADSFYGEDRGLRSGLQKLLVPYVMALKPSHAGRASRGCGRVPERGGVRGWLGECQTLWQVGTDHQNLPRWQHTRVVGIGDRGRTSTRHDKTERAVVATTDPQTLPDLTTWYLVTNLPAPTTYSATPQPFTAANLEEVIRLYGLRMWVEQSRHPGQTHDFAGHSIR
jgi:hypothetical protein